MIISNLFNNESNNLCHIIDTLFLKSTEKQVLYYWSVFFRRWSILNVQTNLSQEVLKKLCVIIYKRIQSDTYIDIVIFFDNTWYFANRHVNIIISKDIFLLRNPPRLFCLLSKSNKRWLSFYYQFRHYINIRYLNWHFLFDKVKYRDLIFKNCTLVSARQYRDEIEVQNKSRLSCNIFVTELIIFDHIFNDDLILKSIFNETNLNNHNNIQLNDMSRFIKIGIFYLNNSMN